jgi:hypothetical protein
MLDQREQDSNPSAWRKGRFITLVGQHLDLSKNGTSPVAWGCRVSMPQNVKASKHKGQKRTWQLASAGRLQHILLAQGYNLSH